MEKALIFYQILSTNSLTKCMEISLENFHVETKEHCLSQLLSQHFHTM